MPVAVKYGPSAWKRLHGIFCVYKYRDVDLYVLKKRIAGALVRDLNLLKVREPRQLVKIEGSVGVEGELSVSTKESYADNILVTGPRYQPKDFIFGWATNHGPLTTGLTVLGIGKYASRIHLLPPRQLLRGYEIEVELGLVTDDLTDTGKVLEKTSFKHVNIDKLERILASVQASHQTVAYKYAGVNLDSQKAYEIASKGLVRPAENSQFLLYAVKCLKFEPPDFTIEVHCINENEHFLKELVHDIGARLKCWASTSKVRMTRYGPFTLEHALLRKHWTLNFIIENIELCTPIFNDKYITPDPVHFQQLQIN